MAIVPLIALKLLAPSTGGQAGNGGAEEQRQGRTGYDGHGSCGESRVVSRIVLNPRPHDAGRISPEAGPASLLELYRKAVQRAWVERHAFKRFPSPCRSTSGSRLRCAASRCHRQDLESGCTVGFSCGGGVRNGSAGAGAGGVGKKRGSCREEPADGTDGIAPLAWILRRQTDATLQQVVSLQRSGVGIAALMRRLEAGLQALSTKDLFWQVCIERRGQAKDIWQGPVLA